MRFIFPESWYTDVIVLRGGGRDDRGNPTPVVEIPVTRCLIAQSSTKEGDGFDDIAESRMRLFRSQEPYFAFQSTDRVRIPEGARMAGEWAVDGRPSEWPAGVEVWLKAA